MKTKLFVAFGILCVFGLAVVMFWPGENHSQLSAAPFVTLSSVPVLEIPVRAAEMVHAAPEANREEMACNVVRAVKAIARPGALPFVVSSICRSNPEVSGAVVGVAAQLQPEDVLIFCKAALSGAPGKVYDVVYQACQAAPTYCAAIALTATKQLPSANDLILAGFANAHPELEPYLEKAEIQAGPDVEAVVKQTVVLVNEAISRQSK